MDIWILVVVLLVIAVILFVLSLYNNDTKNIEEQLNEFSTQQSQEMYSIKSRVSELEKGNQVLVNEDENEVQSNDYNRNMTTTNETEQIDDDVTITSVSENTREEVIRLYSQGYTIHEIGHEVALNTRVIQEIIDDYIENR